MTQATDRGSRTPILPDVIGIHIEEAANLHVIRTGMVRGAHVKLHVLRRFDERAAAHLAGIAIADDAGAALCARALERTTTGTLFVAATMALERHDAARLSALCALAESLPDARSGFLSAFGWATRDDLKRLISGYLRSDNVFLRYVGLTACALHRVDPGQWPRWLTDHERLVRERALRTVGELGRSSLIEACVDAAAQDDSDQYWPARSAVLLGDQGAALQTLCGVAAKNGPHRMSALQLTIQVMSLASAHKWLTHLSEAGIDPRILIAGSGVSGDPLFVPWLVRHMGQPATGRIAGEAFGLITGADLVALKLERSAPVDFVVAPSDDPNEFNVDSDPDEGLPWPDAARIDAWWATNSHKFQKGTRYFMGAPVTREHCVDVLKNGYQRQRILAAHYLCLLEPGTPLFNTSAPAWRQQRLLAKMG
jgi:uncharacterized protein (TIGR02270 family)